MKVKLIYIGILCIGILGHSQTIEKYSIDSGGLSASSGNIQILYTIGEVNVQEWNSGNIQVSEGFINSSSEGTLGIVEVNPEENALLYPNPAREKFYVSGIQPIKQLILYDASGKIIAKTNQSQMAVSDLASGVYFVKIITQNTNTVKRLVVK